MSKVSKCSVLHVVGLAPGVQTHHRGQVAAGAFGPCLVRSGGHRQGAAQRARVGDLDRVGAGAAAGRLGATVARRQRDGFLGGAQTAVGAVGQGG